MSITINFKALVSAIICSVLAIMTAIGTIDNYITFAGEANAAAFCLVTGMMAIMSTAASFNVNH